MRKTPSSIDGDSLNGSTGLNQPEIQPVKRDVHLFRQTYVSWMKPERMFNLTAFSWQRFVFKGWEKKVGMVYLFSIFVIYVAILVSGLFFKITVTCKLFVLDILVHDTMIK